MGGRCTAGGFSPLRGFLGRADYESMLDTMRLGPGLLWPIPVTLDVPDALAEGLTAGDRLALQDPEDFPHAIPTVGDMWHPDKRREAAAAYGADSDAHPGVRHLYEQGHAPHIGDTVSGGRIAAPPYQKNHRRWWADRGSCRAGLAPPTTLDGPASDRRCPPLAAKQPRSPRGTPARGVGRASE
ncbi:sulfate adenylyltransferase [bacterium BMS3Abin12]|nr:sulfate adenylyltransferase [bacterium BMS3Abin12]